MKTQNLKSVTTGLIAAIMIACFTISAKAETITPAKADTGKMAKMDKMSKKKMSKSKMSKDKMSKDKMAKKDTSGKM